MPETYVGKLANLRCSADQGTHRVSLSVDGRETTVTADCAVAFLSKLRRAIKTARTPAP